MSGKSNKVIKQLVLLRKEKAERARQGHVLVQGIKTIQELASKGIPINTLGITITTPENSTAESSDDHAVELRGSSLELVQAISRGQIQAQHYLAVSRTLTSKLLGTQSLTSDHEVWAKVQVTDLSHRFDLSPTSSSSSSKLERMLVLDRITDPGNMGLIIRAGSALSWDGSWHTPGTVDEMNDKVVRASRALCLEWPVKAGGTWSALEQFLQHRSMTLVVGDMLPSPAHSQQRLDIDPHQLVWWNWPLHLSRKSLPQRIALVLGSEHHGVRATQEDQAEQRVKDKLLQSAIRVSIPMAPGVESMNVATAATTMMWEINRLASRSATPQILDIL
ncbi:hypothetical protein BGW41_000724 [Actinomortierella wolfii]|nr:hypothetical protein BGW41_000724 [Actinomortierella wolfii]